MRPIQVIHAIFVHHTMLAWEGNRENESVTYLRICCVKFELVGDGIFKEEKSVHGRYLTLSGELDVTARVPRK